MSGELRLLSEALEELQEFQQRQEKFYRMFNKLDLLDKKKAIAIVMQTDKK